MSEIVVGSVTFSTLPPKRPDPIEFVRAAERAQAEFEARDEYIRRLETDNNALRSRIAALETELASARNLYAAQEERYERGRKDEDAARERIAAFEAQVAELTADRERLDWEERNPTSIGAVVCFGKPTVYFLYGRGPATYTSRRAAIDAARTQSA